MIQVAIMIEGQDGLTWARWQRLARAVEDLDFAGLYRSDHYTNATPPDKDSLELWVSLTWLASHTSRIEFGPLVSPLSFRDPTMTARMASAVDDLSGGRLHLGLGAGWQEREHTHFGWDLLETRPRFDRFEEGLEVVTRLLRSDQPISFDGKYYRIHEATLLPRPARPGGPPIVIGGKGLKRAALLTARYAAEWNAVFMPPDQIGMRNQRLDELLAEWGRKPADVRRSLMTGLIFGRDDRDLAAKLATMPGGSSVEALQAQGVCIGTPNQIVDHLGRLAEIGLYRVMLQWLNQDDLDGLEAFAKSILPQVMR